MRESLRTMSYGNSNLFESGNLMPNGSSISSIKIRLSARFHNSPLIVIAHSSYFNLFLNFCFVFSKLNSAYSFSFCVVKYLFRLVSSIKMLRIKIIIYLISYIFHISFLNKKSLKRP
jgi:hypothetical protein